MIVDAADIAILIGLANGFILLIKPIARVHSRIDRNAQALEVLERDVVRIMQAIAPDR